MIPTEKFNLTNSSLSKKIKSYYGKNHLGAKFAEEKYLRYEQLEIETESHCEMKGHNYASCFIWKPFQALCY